MCKEPGDEIAVRLGDLHTSDVLVDDALDEVRRHGLEKALNPFGTDAVIDVHDEWLVVTSREHGIGEARLPGFGSFIVGESLTRVLLARPLYQVIYILEVVVERHAADSAILGEISDRNFCQGFGEEKVLERLLEGTLGQLSGHKTLSMFNDRIVPAQAREHVWMTHRRPQPRKHAK